MQIPQVIYQMHISTLHVFPLISYGICETLTIIIFTKSYPLKFLARESATQDFLASSQSK